MPFPKRRFALDSSPIKRRKQWQNSIKTKSNKWILKKNPCIHNLNRKSGFFFAKDHSISPKPGNLGRMTMWQGMHVNMEEENITILPKAFFILFETILSWERAIPWNEKAMLSWLEKICKDWAISKQQSPPWDRSPITARA